MRPYIRFGRYSKRWYVDVAREDATCHAGTQWTGYDTLPEAMEAALEARIAEPA